MLNQQIDYASLVEQALLRVVHDVLDMVAQHGLPGRHHLYITFRTDHPDVVIDDMLLARYPNEMTIVLQHEFWGLEVEDDRFAVTLSFNNAPQRIDVPFSAVTVFADPSVEFGLQFTRASAPAAETATASPTPAPVAKLPVAAEKSGGQDGTGPDGPSRDTALGPAEIDEAAKAAEERAEQDETEGESGEKVVTLDRFRKK